MGRYSLPYCQPHFHEDLTNYWKPGSFRNVKKSFQKGFKKDLEQYWSNLDQYWSIWTKTAPFGQVLKLMILLISQKGIPYLAVG